MLANFDVTPSFLFMVLLACNKLQPSKTQASQVDCNDFPCFSGGTCIRGSPDMCSCPPGFVQPFCTFSCPKTPCVNGVCVDEVCNCPPNFAGPRCESAIAAYLSPRAITVTEGHVGQKAVTVQVCRQPSSEEVTLAVYTTIAIAGNSALPDVDFVNINPGQDVTISAGQPCTPVNVFIISDLTKETMSEVFFILLNDPQPSSSSMVHFVPGNHLTIISITDDDPGCLMEPCQNGGTCNDDDLCSCQPGFVGPSCQSTIEVFLSPLEVSVTEGNVGDDISVQIRVCRQQFTLTSTVTVTTSQDSAMTSSDFAFINTPVTIPIGQVCVPVDISIVSDMIFEPTEEFHVVISPTQLPSSVYVAFGRDTATVTIIDNDDVNSPPQFGPCPTEINTVTSGNQFLLQFTTPSCTDPNGNQVTVNCFPAAGSTIANIPDVISCICTDSSQATDLVVCPVNQPPTVQCPADFSVTAPPLSTPTTVQFTPPQCVDNQQADFLSTCTPPSGSSFNAGSNTVECTCQDSGGLTGSCTFIVTVQNGNSPPQIGPCPIDIKTFPSAGNQFFLQFTTPSCTDPNGDQVTVTCNPAAGSAIANIPGVITCICTDSSQTTDSVTCPVNQPPTVQCPAAFSVTAPPLSTSTTATFNTPQCVDNQQTNFFATCAPPTGSLFNAGPNTVECTCEDSGGLTDSCTFIVTVQRNQPPTVQCPADFSVTAPPPSIFISALFNTPQCVDNQQANFVATCTPSSGSSFNAGQNTVECACQDSGGLTGSCTFIVTVQSVNSPPQIGPCPTDFRTTQSGNQLFLQFTTPSCTDLNSDTVTVTCNPAANSFVDNIPGVITCTCTDSSQATDSVVCPDCIRLNSAGLCSSGECSCTNRTCTSQTGRCEATCSAFQCPANIVSESLSQVNPESSVEIKCILVGSTAVVIRLQIRLSRSEGAIDDRGITRDSNPDISANRREVTDRVISVSEDDQFFCILSLGASIVGSINVTGFVYKLPSIRDPPTQLTRNTTSVTIIWRPWDEETDIGDPPVVAYIPYYKMDPSQDWMSGSRIQADQTLEYTASSLESDRNYTFSVAAVREGEGGEGPRGPAVTIKTLCIEVVPQMVTTTLTATNDVTVTWQQPTVQCSIGITQFTIYYEIEGDVSSRQEAGRADQNAESFTVNGPLLEPGTTYNIAVTVTTDQESALSEGRTVTATNPTDPESAGSSVAIIIVAVIVVLIVLILLFLIVIVVRKRKMEDQPDPIDNQPLNDLGKQSGPSGNTYHSSGAVNTALNVTKAKKTKESSAASSSVIDVGGIYGNLEPPSPIRVAEFPEYIISNIDKVEHEFGLLEGSQQKHPWTVADQEYNRKKNRFRNMYPYDHCRVVLPKLPGDHSSDYYNASFILNERDVRAYIASQGPNKASVDDFWRLIWEQNVQTIVMLANLYEEAKERCLQYWPKEENEIQSFGYIDVTWTKTQHFADYVIRTLSVDRGGTIREVKQLHFKEWPDKDIPENAMCLVEFARHCKLIHFKKQTPLLIHCSAGIGRTGTFIGLLSMMDVLQSKEYIDIFAFVNKMRENRVNMIQTKKQYRYLHTCLYEFHLTRDCQISSQILSRFKVHDNKAAILREFELLSEMEMSITNDSIKTGGTKDSLARGNSTDSLETDGSMTREHAPRDRFGNMVPVERRKVFMLSSSPSNPDNYINASFVKSYEKKDAFITTQSPLPNTIEDFWRMIYDHKCRTVVMLNQLDGSDKTCVQYWPDRGSLQYGIMTVTCITTEQQSDYVKRTFDVTLNDSANVISVTHLQLEQWPPNGSPQSVIRLITDAQKLQKEANVDKPLVVHCINGFGRSGVFVTVQSEMERIRATGLVDIFATVKKLRNEHQHMMRKKMDYILCFDFLIEFSKRYGNYENW